MAKQVQLRRGTTAELSSVTGAAGEVIVDTTKDTLTVHDGYTAGGVPLLKEDLGNLANNSININKLTLGTSNQVLTTNTSGTALEWGYANNASALSTGSLPVARLPSGSVIQTVFSQYTSRYLFEPGAGEWRDGPSNLGNGSIAITPRSATSRLLISATCCFGQVDTWSSHGFLINYKIGGGSWNQGNGCQTTTYIASRSGGGNTSTQFHLLQLNSTDTVYVKLSFRSQDSGNYVRINYGAVDNNGDNRSDYNQSSNVTIMELV